MLYKIFSDARFFRALLAFDRDLARQTQAAGCRQCLDGPLHVANYRRKPRGISFDDDDLCQRFSFCCGREGCRHRATPPSVRFLGRRVYFAAVFLLVSAMRHGVSQPRAAQIEKLIPVDRRTLERWRRWWRETFVQTPFWRMARGRFASLAGEGAMPMTLLAAFGFESMPSYHVPLLRALAFLGPLCASAVVAPPRSLRVESFTQRMLIDRTSSEVYSGSS